MMCRLRALTADCKEVMDLKATDKEASEELWETYQAKWLIPDILSVREVVSRLSQSQCPKFYLY